MAATVLLAGNGISNFDQNTNWESLLRLLHEKYYDPAVSFETLRQRPFPLLYEQIVLWQLQKGKTEIERTLKEIISAETAKISPNKVHQAIANGKWQHIITANYEFNLCGCRPKQLKNEGCIRELLYSVFRHFSCNKKCYWHLHGDVQHINSINLGYEHYCGQLQKMREYTTGSYQASQQEYTQLFSLPLVNRPYLLTDTVYSWIDFFFRDDTIIKILGFRLELEELDLWWLLTYRAKILYGAKKGHRQPKRNRVQYFIPAQYTKDSTGAKLPTYLQKKNLLEAMNIEVIEIDMPHSEAYYMKILNGE